MDANSFHDVKFFDQQLPYSSIRAICLSGKVIKMILAPDCGLRMKAAMSSVVDHEQGLRTCHLPRTML